MRKAHVESTTANRTEITDLHVRRERLEAKLTEQRARSSEVQRDSQRSQL
jgi:hypothetical protein